MVPGERPVMELVKLPIPEPFTVEPLLALVIERVGF